MTRLGGANEKGRDVMVISQARRTGRGPRTPDKARYLLEDARRIEARPGALDKRERRLSEREARVDAHVVAVCPGKGVEPATELSVGPVANQIRRLMADTGDDLSTVALGIGVESAWASDALSGRLRRIDIDGVRRVCEGLECSPYDLFGTEAARSIAHLYGPELWPRWIEPLDPPR